MIGELALDDMSKLERQHVTLVFSMQMRHFEDMHNQHELGVVNKETWEANERGIRQLVSNNSGGELWDSCRHGFRTGFVQLVDDKVRDG